MQLNQRNNQSIIRKTHMLGPHQSPFISHDLMSQIPLFWNYEKFIHTY